MIEDPITEQALPAGYTWRPATLSDVPGLVALYTAVDSAYGTHWGGTEEEIRVDFEEPGLELDLDTLLALAPDGEIAAVGWLMPPRAARDKDLAILWGVTHPHYCRRGLGSTLLAWLEERACQKFQGKGVDRPFFLRTVTPDTMPERMAFYESRGYQLVRSYYRMRRSFSTPLPETRFPAGVRIGPWEQERDAEALEVINIAFQDHWSSAEMTPAQWELFVTGSVSFRRDFSLMAFAGDRLVGACINRILEYDNHRTGIHEGWIGTLGVLPDWRKLGVGSALLCESMLRFQAAGYTSAGLSVDTENLTGALAIYERLGFAPVQRSLAYARPLVAVRSPTTG